MNSDVPPAEQESSKDISLENESDENSLNSKTSHEPSTLGGTSNDHEVEQKLESDSIDQSSTSSEKNIKDQDTESRLQQLEKEYETLNSQYVRIAADFDNF